VAGGEIISIVEESADGGYEAKALGHSIFTQAETIEALRGSVRDAVRCHFDESDRTERHPRAPPSSACTSSRTSFSRCEATGGPLLREALPELRPFGYETTRQSGSHLRLISTARGREHRVTILRHRSPPAPRGSRR
jgi:predicted RNA binding protein YcfA (HicA-like mRNA interferase family)